MGMTRVVRQLSLFAESSFLVRSAVRAFLLTPAVRPELRALRSHLASGPRRAENIDNGQKDGTSQSPHFNMPLSSGFWIALRRRPTPSTWAL